MSVTRLGTRVYIEASEDLLKLKNLTDEEIETVQTMLDRLSAMLTSERDGEP